ncbi:TPA: helix-turn-helix transcriptional regulator [Serratia marcescens]
MSEANMEDIHLIPEKDVMKKLGISSRQTLYNYQNKHCFPKPIRTHPKAYLENAVNQWILNGGINQKAAS